MSSRKERKVVTVLFADLVGFTARAEQLDPEDVEAILRPYHERLRSELERFGGTVEKFIGDAVMALFGAPAAHEDDPERAVRAALAIRDWAREEGEIEVRIAVNTGEALINLAARPETGEGMAAGDVVNTAARLQPAAPVNGIVVGEMTHRATRHVIDYRDLEAVEAKGKAAPVRVWEALQARSRLGVDLRRQVRSALVGRERELGLLRDTLTRVREERSPQLVTLVGVPGIGKSRLVYELMQVVNDSGVLTYWRQGRSLPYGEGVTYWALSEMVKAQAGILETDARDVVQLKLRDAVQNLIADRADADWVESYLRPLAGVTDESEPGAGDRGEAFAAWRRFFEAMAEHRPLVLVFDDLHWADDELLDFVDHLVEWATGVPILVLCIARPELLERRSNWGGGKLNATTLSISPLSENETAQLLATLVGRPLLEAKTQAALLARAGGNPLYAEQYAEMHAERPDGGDVPVPESVQGIIAARIDLLPPEEKSLLQDAAVLGKVVWLGGLVDGRTRRTAEERLHALERKGFVDRARQSSVADEAEYAFRHVLVRDVAYGQIPRAERAEKHRKAAEWIASLGRRDDHAEMLAHHYVAAAEYAEAAGMPVDEMRERARLALREAGDRALALNAFAAAARFYGEALRDWPGGDPERPYLLLSYGKALLVSEEGGDDALAEAAEALARAGDNGPAAEAEAFLADLAITRGDSATAENHFERASKLTAEAEDSPAKAFVLGTISRHLMLTDPGDEALRASREALALAERLGRDDIRAGVLTNIATVLFHVGDVEEVVAKLEQAIDLARGANTPRELIRAYNNLHSFYAFYGDVGRSHELTREVGALAERYGDATFIHQHSNLEIQHLWWSGRWDECLSLLDIDLRRPDIGRNEIWDLAWRAKLLVARGDIEGATRDAERVVLLGGVEREPQSRYQRGAAVRVLHELGRPQEAESLALEVLGEWHERQFAAFNWFFDVAVALTASGRADDVHALGRAARFRTRWLEAAEQYAIGTFAQAAETLATIGSRPDEAYARLKAAERLVAEGRRTEADQQLQQALSFWRSVGATRHVREGEALLAATA